MKKIISVVIPVYNEERNIVTIYNALEKIFELYLKKDSYKIIFIDDGSTDNSWQCIKQLMDTNLYVEGISFSRNFGQQMALMAGYDYAQGDVIITMDADLQHPPEIIPEMIQRWREGFDIVYGRRAYREEGWLRQLTGNLYYKLLNQVSDIPLPGDVSEFRLIDKKVHEVIKKCKDREPYMRGTIAWAGFSHTFVDFNPVARARGVSGYNWTKLIKLAFDGIATLSRFPLEIAAYIGTFVIVTGTLMFGYIAFDAFVYYARYPLFKWLTVVLYMATGVQFLLMWLLGEYIGRIYTQLKQRPLYVVKEYCKGTNRTAMKAYHEKAHISRDSHL